jgi:UPF0716 protein FxsA
MRFRLGIVPAVLLWPAVEIAAFILLAQAAGGWTALLLLVLLSVTGAVVLRHAGRRQLAQLRASLRQGGMSAVELKARDLVTMLAGILLLVPGLVTGLLGLLLLLPGAENWAAAAFGRVFPAPRRRTPDGIVELDRAEWRQMPEDRIEGPQR